MKHWLIIVGSFCLIGISACDKKELPEKSEAGEPRFTITGSVDGDAKAINAGKDDYYMYTYFTSDSNNRYQLTGHFSETNCKDCPESLKIELPAFRNAKGQFNLDQALSEGGHTYYNPSEAYKVQFEAIPDTDHSAAFTWDFGDEKSSRLKVPTHYYPVSDGSTEYEAELKINYDNGSCIKTATRSIRMEQRDCRVNFTAEPLNHSEVTFESRVENLDSPIDYFWFKDETRMSKVANPTHDFKAPGTYDVCLQVEGASGCSVKRCRKVDVFDKGCNANFNYTVSSNTTKVDREFVNISWWDKAGNRYSTGKNKQPETSYFRILEAKKYEENENGKPTYQLKVEFDCVVYSGDQKKRLKDFQGKMAVAYPGNK